jgi:hypothetical protein
VPRGGRSAALWAKWGKRGGRKKDREKRRSRGERGKEREGKIKSKRKMLPIIDLEQQKQNT